MLPKNKVCKYFNKIHLRNSSKFSLVPKNRNVKCKYKPANIKVPGIIHNIIKH